MGACSFKHYICNHINYLGYKIFHPFNKYLLSTHSMGRARVEHRGLGRDKLSPFRIYIPEVETVLNNSKANSEVNKITWS